MRSYTLKSEKFIFSVLQKLVHPYKKAGPDW